MNNEDGRSGAEAPSGCQPSASAAVPASSQSGIPNAVAWGLLQAVRRHIAAEGANGKLTDLKRAYNMAAAQVTDERIRIVAAEQDALTEYAAQYELCCDGGYYTPTKHERLLIEDALQGWVADRETLLAQAIEARRAATGTGAVEDESAVPKGCVQTFSPEALEYLAQQHEDEQAELIASGHPDTPATVSTVKALRAIEAAMTGGRP